THQRDSTERSLHRLILHLHTTIPRTTPTSISRSPTRIPTSITRGRPAPRTGRDGDLYMSDHAFALGAMVDCIRAGRFTKEHQRAGHVSVRLDVQASLRRHANELMMERMRRSMDVVDVPVAPRGEDVRGTAAGPRQPATRRPRPPGTQGQGRDDRRRSDDRTAAEGRQSHHARSADRGNDSWRSNADASLDLVQLTLIP